MDIHMDVGNHERLQHWLNLAQNSPSLSRVLWKADGWAAGMKILFDKCPHPVLSLEDIDAIDSFGTAKRFLVETWVHGDELARQIEAARQIDLKAQERRNKNKR